MKTSDAMKKQWESFFEWFMVLIPIIEITKADFIAACTAAHDEQLKLWGFEVTKSFWTIEIPSNYGTLLFTHFRYRSIYRVWYLPETLYGVDTVRTLFSLCWKINRVLEREWGSGELLDIQSILGEKRS